MKNTLFVTVGTGKFEQLVREVDNLVEKKAIKEKVVIQIGSGDYIPKNCEYFRFTDSLDSHYKKARLIISHGGPGTVFEILRKGKKLIAVANQDRTDPKHQVEFLGAIAESKSLLLCEDTGHIEKYLNMAKTYRFKKYTSPHCTLDKEIIRFLGD